VAALHQQASRVGPWEGLPFLDLRPLGKPWRGVPGRLRRLLPDPMTEGGHRRYWHLDVAVLTEVELRRELERIVVAVGLAEDDQVPPWLPKRRTTLADEMARRRRPWRRIESATVDPDPIPLEALG
jgi:hypothetical protein